MRPSRTANNVRYRLYKITSFFFSRSGTFVEEGERSHDLISLYYIRFTSNSREVNVRRNLWPAEPCTFIERIYLKKKKKYLQIIKFYTNK